MVPADRELHAFVAGQTLLQPRLADWVLSSHRRNPSSPWPQVETGLAGSSRRVRLVAMGLVVFLLSYATAYAETLTIAHVSRGSRGRDVGIGEGGVPAGDEHRSTRGTECAP